MHKKEAEKNKAKTYYCNTLTYGKDCKTNIGVFKVMIIKINHNLTLLTDFY